MRSHINRLYGGILMGQRRKIWRPIIIYKNNKLYDFSTRYAISNYGEVKNINTGKILKLKLDKRGYYVVKLRFKGKRKLHNFSVHRLVATAFIPNFDNLPMINHIDGNRTNNCVDNLEWCDAQYNTKYAYDNNPIFRKFVNRLQKDGTDKVRKMVNQYTLDNKYIKTYKSYIEAGKAVGVSDVAIRKCCKGKTKQSAGFKWKNVKDDVLYIICNDLIIKFGK